MRTRGSSRRSLWSLWSDRSILSIGSAGSVMSMFSVGSFQSQLAALSFQSDRSVLSGQSRRSALAWQSDGAVRSRATGPSEPAPLASAGMARMSMNKVIHAAFRRDLDRFVAALQAFPDGDLLRARQLGTAWENFDDQLTYHHHGEHETAWPALEAVGVSKELLATMDAEHDTMAAALSLAREAMQTLARTASATDAEAALAAMEELRSVTTSHLDHEEAELESVYLDKHDDPAIQEMGRKFAKVSPSRGGRFFAWVTDGATPEEDATVRGNVPGPVLAVITGIWGRGYRRDVASVWKS